MKYFRDEFLGKRKKEFLLYSLNATKNQTYPIGSEDDEENDGTYIYLPSEGRQPFTRWRWSSPKSTQLKVKAKTFYIKYEKELSSIDKIILKSFQKKYLYHAIDDIFCLLKSKPIERDNILAILYSPVLSLQNHFSIDFFDIWIDEISITKASKVNKFLTTNNSNFQPVRYITIRLLYTNKRLPKKTESFW